MQRRFAIDGETNKSENNNSSSTRIPDDPDQHNSVKGYRKLAALIFLFIAFIFFRANVFDIATVAGQSMDDFLIQGDTIIVKKFNVSDITRYDIVTARIGDQNMIKRVIGLPDETIQITDGKVFINGEEQAAEFAFFTEFAGMASDPYRLGEDEYFLMGDNRSESYDSRDYGAVNRNQISGIAVATVLPVWRMKII